MKELNFTKKEKEFILDQIDIQLDSYRSGGSTSNYLDFSGSFSDDMYDIKVMKSICKKLDNVNCTVCEQEKKSGN